MSFSQGLAAVNARVEPDARAGVTSTYFAVLYVALSLPVIGLGAASQVWGLAVAGVAFTIGVAVLAAVALAALLVRQHRARRPSVTPGR